MIRFHFSSATSSAETLDSRNGGSDLGALGISQNFREKTEFCLKSALFSADHSRKGKRAEYVSLCTGDQTAGMQISFVSFLVLHKKRK